MRSADEQLRLIRERAEIRRQKRQTALRRSAAALCCLALAASLGFVLPRLDVGVTLPEGAAVGSIVLLKPQLGCIVLAVLAFCLGVFVTLLCVHRREQQGEKEDEES